MTWMTVGRRFLAGLIVALVLVGAIGSTMRTDWRVCREEAVRNASDVQVVEVCRPVLATDAPIVVSLVLAVVLLAPDFQRVAIPGVFELESKVEAQARRQDVLEQRVGLLVQQATTVRQDVNLAVLPPSADLATVAESVEERAERFAEGGE